MYKTRNLLRNNQRWLAVFFLIASMAACQKDVLKPSDVSNNNSLNATVSTRSLLDILWSDNIELLTFLSLGVSRQTSTSYGITATTSFSYQGTRSARFELRSSDPETNGGTRCELSFSPITSLNRWYSYALYAPSAYYKYDGDDDVITQWHQGGGETPALCLRVREDRLYIRVLGTWVDLGVFEKDKWQAFVMHIKHSAGSDGLIEMWRNGVKILNRYGPNMYKISWDIYYPKLKMGIYKSDWNGSSTTSTNIRVLYYDDIRIGSEYASYATMAPTPNANIVTPPPPVTEEPSSTTTTLGVADFRLINAATEQELMSIANGQTISLSALNLTKTNIRAVGTSGTKCMKLELSGTQSKSFIDDDSPYALHGDDDDGNFYYGNWNPPALGTYTLKATPFPEEGANGAAGVSRTVTFTIVP